MVPAWMLYATAIGGLAFITALALEHLLGIWSLPRRAAWVLAMAVTVALPLWLATRPATRGRTPTNARFTERPVAGGAVRATPSRSVARRSVPWRLRVMRWSLRFDRRTRTAWTAGSVAVGLTFIAAYASMLRRRRAWREDMLHGHRVLMTNDVGPAVIGFLRPRIVIPEWALSLPHTERRLMLDHELEHVNASDPKLLLFAGVVLVLFPWNAALWLMTRRLRLAIEIDCDARVVRGTDAADEYGLFLVAVGERRAHGLFLAASLAERRSSLERRIHAMTSLRPRYPILASVPFVALALGATLLAAQTPTPPAAAGGVIARTTMRDTALAANLIRLSNTDVRAIIAQHHPAIANGTAIENTVNIVLASTGEVVTTRAVNVTEAPVARGGGGVMSVRAVRAVPTEVRTERAPTIAQRDTARTAPLYWQFGGIRIDRSLINGYVTSRYSAGEVSANAVTVNVVTLVGNSLGAPR